jgi:hypothetical protein
MKTSIASLFAVMFTFVAATLAEPAAPPPATQPDVARLIAALSSDNGATRASATKAIFAMGKDALEPLAKAGAKQVAPMGTIASTRIDVVYSLLDGLKPTPPRARAGYAANGFGLTVEKGCTSADVAAMGRKHGFAMDKNNDGTDKFDADGFPQCYVQLSGDRKLADVLTAVLSEEPKVITVNLNYFEE